MRRWDFVDAFLQGELLDKVQRGRVLLDALRLRDWPRRVQPLWRRHGAAHREAHLRHCAGGAALAGHHLPLPHIKAGFVSNESVLCVFTKRETVQTPSGPREETLIIGCYVDDLFTLYSHDVEHLLYHSLTKQLVVDWKV